MNPRSVFAIILTALILGGGFLLGAPSAHAAFGISPPFLNADHLVPGVTYTQTVYLVQDQPNVDLPIKAMLSVPDNIKSWITIDQGFSFVIPAGTRQYPVVISVHVPDGEGLGKYNGNLSFTGQPAQSGQVSIALGVNVAINLTVGTGIFEQYSIDRTTFPDIEEGWNPKVDIKFNNQGNVPEALNGATFEILDQYDAVRLAYIQKNSGFPTTKAFTTDEYLLEFPTDFHLGIGDYWGNVVLYKDGKVVGSYKNLFHVLPAGSISGPWGIAMNFLQRNMWIAYLALLIVIALVIFAIYRKRTRHARVA